MGTAAWTLPTVEERIQRTERELIEAALAVNAATTLEDALDSLAGFAHRLTSADSVSVVEWRNAGATATIVASTSNRAVVGRSMPPAPKVAELVARGRPFMIGAKELTDAPAEARGLAEAFRTILAVPIREEGVTLSFQAVWVDKAPQDTVDAAVSKLRLLGRLTGIAFRTEAERGRAREEARLRAVLEAVPQGLILRAGGGSQINTVGRELLALNGDVPDELQMFDLDGRALPYEETPIARTRETGVRQEFLLHAVRGDGERRLFTGSVAPVKDDAGQTFATVSLFRDVTEEHERQYLTQQFLEMVYDSLPTAVAVIDPKTRAVVSANRAFLALVGREMDDVLGQRPPYPWWAPPTRNAPPADDDMRFEALFTRPDGSIAPVEIVRSLIRGTDGEEAAVVVIFNDLSEQRAYERQLIQSGKLASIGELAAGGAHEINNPLFAILGLVEFLLLESEEGTKAHERLQLIQATALEIKEIVRALLDFARERSDARAVVSLVDVARQTVELMRRTSAKKDVEIVERYPDEDVRVEASANQLKQIFVNLISNAKNAIPSGGTVTVAIGRDGETAWADVVDTGEGVAADAADRLFEPFFTTRRDRGGTGLGLSVSLGIAQAHGGSLTLESTSPEPATFRLRLPISENGA